VRTGEKCAVRPDVHLKTQGKARIELDDRLVISRGTHIVAMAGIKIGQGSLIGEHTSIRDANYYREPDQPREPEPQKGTWFLPPLDYRG
jgi:acetyltransferase-like isoleucine patch superfamily enzyme